MEFPLSNADQIGIVVHDLDAFLQMLNDLLGIDGFEVLEYPPDAEEAGITYYGEPANFKLKLAFRKVGKFEVEVIQPLWGESTFKDFLEENGPGIHHVRFTESRFDEIAQTLQDRGIQMMASGRGVHGPTRWAYFDTSDLLQGLIVELKKPAG